MAELIAQEVQTAELVSSGYVGQPEGNIDLTENNTQYDVTSYKYATTKVPEPSGIPVDEGSQTPIYFGVNANGFVISSNSADETPVAFGVNANGRPYVKGGTA